SGRRSEALEERPEVTRAEEPEPLAGARAANAVRADRRLGALAEGPARRVAAERLLERSARRPEERARVGAEDVAGLRHQHQLVEVERVALPGDERGEREAALVELAAVDRDERP